MLTAKNDIFPSPPPPQLTPPSPLVFVVKRFFVSVDGGRWLVLLYDTTMQRLRLRLKRKGFENGTVSLIVRCSISE